MHGHGELLRELDRARLQHLGAERRHLEHLVVGDAGELARVRHHVRVGGVDAVHVGEDLAHVGLERRGQRDAGEIGAAPAQRRDVAGLGHALKARDDDDLAGVEGGMDALGGDAADARAGVDAVGDHADLRSRERAGGLAQRLERHGEEADGDLLARGQHHVHLARIGRGRDGLRQSDEPVGGLAHGGDHHHQPVTLRGGLGDAPGDVLDLLGVGDGRAAVLLDDQLAHERAMLHDGRAECKGTAG